MTTFSKVLMVLISVSVLYSCSNNSGDQFNPINSKSQIKSTLQTLLSSIENKNLDSLKSVMPPSGKFELILTGTPITYTVAEFVDFHEGWFKDKSWTMETKILNIEPGKYIGTATTEAIYREPDRDGKPYFNHTIVSYVLEKGADNNWYVIKDHASTLKKSTD